MSTRVTFRAVAPVLAIFLITGCLFALTYYHDNKYLAPPPYGENGSITLSDADLERPLPLVDGWLLSVEGGARSETFIGQYSNFSFVPEGYTAFGSATYELTLHYEGSKDQQALVLLIPEIFTNYTVYVNGAEAATQSSGEEISLIVGERTHVVFEVQNQSHYYSGITYPPVIGTARVMANVGYVNAFATAVLVLVSSAAALFALAVRRRGGGDKLVRDFGILCASFALAGAHGTVWRLGVAGTWWYALEDAAWIVVLASGVSLAMRVTGLTGSRDALPVDQEIPRHTRLLGERAIRHIAPVGLLFLQAAPVIVFVWVCFVIPAFPVSIEAYGWFQTGIRLACWILFVACAIVGVRDQLPEARYILYGCAVLGAALVSNLLDNNAYEPLYGLWQQEYAGLMLVGVFGWMLVNRVRRLRAAQEQVRDLEVQVRSATESLAHLRRGEQEACAARHDLRHHIGTLRQLAHEGAWDACCAYLDELAGAQLLQSPLRYAENMVINAVLATYLAPAQERGIQVTCDVRVPASLPLRDTELVVLLSNLLSNAVEGCEAARSQCGERVLLDSGEQNLALSAGNGGNDTGGEAKLSISVFIRVKGQRLIVRCINTAISHATFGKTTKADTRYHGYGLSTMKQITRQHCGELLTEVKEGVAIVRMIIPLADEESTPASKMP